MLHSKADLGSSRQAASVSRLVDLTSHSSNSRAACLVNNSSSSLPPEQVLGSSPPRVSADLANPPQTPVLANSQLRRVRASVS